MSSAPFFHAWEYLSDQIEQQQLWSEDKRVLTESLDGLPHEVVISKADELRQYISLGERVSYAVLHILLVYEEDHLL